jgi:hypothetical protein
VFLFGLFNRLVAAHHPLMRTSDMSPKQLSSVPCPTCGVVAGQRCVLYSGGLRRGPHLERKLSAAEAVAKKKSRARRGQSAGLA